MENDYNIKTGDLILFDNGKCNPLSLLIKYFTQSEITHIGMILKDPDFIDPPLQGYYVWESNYEGKPDPQDNKTKLGVQITPLDDMIDYNVLFISTAFTISFFYVTLPQNKIN